jgi:mono/diheme cytochrome c family protein
LAVLAVLVAAGAACREVAENRDPSVAQRGQPIHVDASPVAGPSWLVHLGQAVDATKLGQQGQEQPPPPTTRGQPMPSRAAPNAPFAITGSDVYRYACRSCHGPNGAGSPEQIPSFVDFVRATSASMLAARMKEQGHPADPKLMQQLAETGEKALEDRLQSGGKQMPPAAYLNRDERDAVIAYVKELSGLPASEWSPKHIQEPAVRVGALVANGTCHVCHGATGPGNPHLTMMRGVIPSLASFTTAYGEDEVVAKAQQGKSRMMMMMGNAPNKMPKETYLSSQELAAAYLYLQLVAPVAQDRWPPPQAGP